MIKEDSENRKEIKSIIEQAIVSIYLREGNNVQAEPDIKVFLATEHQGDVLAEALVAAKKRGEINFKFLESRPREIGDEKIGKFVVLIKL